MLMKSARSLITAVFTPLNESLTVNYNIIPSYAKYVADSGIKSILVGGTTGEHVTLNVEERKKLIDAWVKNGKPFGLHIQAHVGGAPLADVLDLAKHCSSAGVDSLLTLSELYFKPNSVNDLVSYIDLVAKAAPNLPVFYYYTPKRNKVEISMPAFVTAATKKIPNFKGLKYAWTDLSEAAQILRLLKDDQQIYSSKETLIAPAALLGIRTFNCTSFNMFPRLAQDIVDAVEKSDVEEARILQEKYSKAVEAITAEGEWVPTMKAAMEIVTGMKVGPPCLPQKPITIEARNRIQSKLRALELVK